MFQSQKSLALLSLFRAREQQKGGTNGGRQAWVLNGQFAIFTLCLSWSATPKIMYRIDDIGAKASISNIASMGLYSSVLDVLSSRLTCDYLDYPPITANLGCATEWGSGEVSGD